MGGGGEGWKGVFVCLCVCLVLMSCYCACKVRFILLVFLRIHYVNLYLTSKTDDSLKIVNRGVAELIMSNSTRNKRAKISQDIVSGTESIKNW